MTDINPDRPAVRKRQKASEQPKPCPTCYAPMAPRRRLDRSGALVVISPPVWECARHGEPTRL